MLYDVWGIINNSPSDYILMQRIVSILRFSYYNYSSGARGSRGTSGRVWENGATSSGSTAYSLRFGSDSKITQGSNYKGYGFSVRCEAK